MAQFATAEELGTFLGRDIKPDKRARAELMLQLASAAVQASARQRLELTIDEQVDLHPVRNPKGTQHELLLPERPVLEVASATIDTLPILGYEATRWGRVRWLYGSLTSARYLGPEVGWPPVITVTYSHGYATPETPAPDPNTLRVPPLPDELRLVVLQAAARGFTNPLGDHSTTTGTYRADHDGGIELTRPEHRIARRYRQVTRG